jgi:glycosyltransferase involved in cell wall biosynthesis
MMKKIVIISTSIDDWGGSEELWGRSLPYFQAEGYQITMMKPLMNTEHPQLKKISDAGVKLIEINRVKSPTRKAIKVLNEFIKKIAFSYNLIGYQGESFKNLQYLLKEEDPALVIISQGINFDGLKYARQCLMLNIPYVVVSQKAVDFYWPDKGDRVSMLETLLKAEKTYFVSKHNLRLTEEQFGSRLANGKVIFNPVKLSGKALPYPPVTNGYHLACIGRLFLLDKGQDIIIRILSEQKWKDRPVTVSFIGKGDDEQGLRDLATLLGVENIDFKGQVDNIEQIWENYHALLLPSRCEGLPLSMVEAMSAGRPVIISDAGGNAELVDEGLSGFIGYPNEISYGEAMERAWQNKSDWEQIGQTASRKIASAVPEKPEYEFAKDVLMILEG